MLPTTHSPVLMPTPISSGDVSGCLAFLVEQSEASGHVQRRTACIIGMVVIRQRRIPERHDVVAHVFVDGALVRHYRLRQWREQRIDQHGQALRIGLVLFRYCRETANIGKQNAHILGFATQDQLVRDPRSVAPPCPATGIAQMLCECAGGLFLPAGTPEHQDTGNCQRCHQRERIIEYDGLLSKCPPRRAHNQRCHQAASNNCDHGTKSRQQD